MQKNKKFRILAVGDMHGDSNLAKKLAERAEKENVNLIVLCGDITGSIETKNLIKPFKDKNKPVLIVPGNHDSPDSIDFLSEFYKIRNIHNNSAIYESVGFFGAGWATNIGPWVTTEKNILTSLENAHSQIEGIEKKVMVTHMHPLGSKSEFSGFKGSDSIRKAIKKFSPLLLIHGHIHEAGGFEETIYNTKVINVARSPVIIEI